jgi:SAM-dependent methyltransferase
MGKAFWNGLRLGFAQPDDGEAFPQSRITAVSNSTPQRLFIEGAGSRPYQSARHHCDMNDFQPDTRFDRIVSVEMFEHMANWQDLLERARGWLLPDGRLFLHVFSHRSQPYRFDTADKTDWIAQHFFTGGIMPSHGLIDHFPQSFTVEQSWRWDGRHYQRTADLWLKNFDANRAAIDEQLRQVYGDKAALWGRRWRLFYLATAGLFGHAQGREWGVSHYRLRPAHEAGAATQCLCRPSGSDHFGLQPDRAAGGLQPANLSALYRLAGGWDMVGGLRDLLSTPAFCRFPQWPGAMPRPGGPCWCWPVWAMPCWRPRLWERPRGWKPF